MRPPHGPCAKCKRGRGIRSPGDSDGALDAPGVGVSGGRNPHAVRVARGIRPDHVLPKRPDHVPSVRMRLLGEMWMNPRTSRRSGCAGRRSRVQSTESPARTRETITRRWRRARCARAAAGSFGFGDGLTRRTRMTDVLDRDGGDEPLRAPERPAFERRRRHPCVAPRRAPVCRRRLGAGVPGRRDLAGCRDERDRGRESGARCACALDFASG